MTYAVKTVENLFTWCGHERYPMMMEISLVGKGLLVLGLVSPSRTEFSFVRL